MRGGNVLGTQHVPDIESQRRWNSASEIQLRRDSDLVAVFFDVHFLGQIVS